ncbi:MAG: hypothetical protein K6C31_02225 [Bacteroidales bacterium]|nr:hypothetical protein [Bacteroidales bacterium]
MDEKLRYNDPELEEEEVEVDWSGIFARTLKRWKTVLLVTFILGCIGLAAALTMRHRYEVAVTLAPELQRRSTSINNITSMLGLGDITLGSNSDAMSITLFPEICRSTPFLTSLFDVELHPYFDPEDRLEGLQEPAPVTVFDHLMGNDLPKRKVSAKRQEAIDKYFAVYNDSIVNVSALTPNQFAVVKALQNRISADVDKMTGVTTVKVVMDDRRMVSELADTVTKRLQEYVTEYRTRKAISDYNYYVTLKEEARRDLVRAQQAYAGSVDYDRSVILQSINSEKQRLQQEVSLANQLYSQLSQQAEMAKAKIQEIKPMYAVIQPSTMPRYPLNSRKKTVIIWGFAGFLLGCLWAAFGLDAFRKARKGVKAKLKEK